MTEKTRGWAYAVIDEAKITKEYICADCGGVFLTDWSDKDAMDEAREIWGQELYETKISIICDNCFSKLHKNVLNHLEERSSKSKVKP